MPKRGIQFRELRTRGDDFPGSMYTTGRYMDGRLLAGGKSSLAFPSADFIFAHPIFIPRSVRIDRIGVHVLTAQAASNVRAGIWEGGEESGFPEALVVDSGNLDTSTTGAKEATIDIPLFGPRQYWAGVVTNNASVALLADDNPAGSSLGVPNLGNTSTASNIQIAHTFGALPNPFGAWSYDDSPQARFRVGLRVA